MDIYPYSIHKNVCRETFCQNQTIICLATNIIRLKRMAHSIDRAIRMFSDKHFQMFNIESNDYRFSISMKYIEIMTNHNCLALNIHVNKGLN